MVEVESGSHGREGKWDLRLMSGDKQQVEREQDTQLRRGSEKDT